jgi:hypothetical protein
MRVIKSGPVLVIVILHADGLHATQGVKYGLPIGQADFESDED